MKDSKLVGPSLWVFVSPFLLAPHIGHSQMYPWTQPNWGFVSGSDSAHSKPFANSLVFDQPFDSSRIRPFPVANSLAAPEPKTPEPKATAAVPPPQQLTHSTLSRIEPQRLRRRVSTPVPKQESHSVSNAGLLARALSDFSPTGDQLRSLRPIPNFDSWMENKVRHFVSQSASVPSTPRGDIAAKPTLPVAAAETQPIPATQQLPAIQQSKVEAPVLVSASAPESDWVDVKLSKLVKSTEARVVLLDEEAHFSGRSMALRGATVRWLSPRSPLITETNSRGFAVSPYPHDRAVKFFAEIPGFLPVTGLAVRGQMTPVFLVRMDRWNSVARSLNLSNPPEQPTALVKILNDQWKAQDSVRIEVSSKSSQAFYAAGAMGIFHPGARESGILGDALLTRLPLGLSYWMPSVKGLDGTYRDWPAHSLSTTGLPPVFSTTLRDGPVSKAETVVVDALSLETPEVNVIATIGGQRGVTTVSSEGILKLEKLHQKSSMDLIELRAASYLPLWIGGFGSASLLPETLYMFTQQHVDQILKSVVGEIPSQRGVVFGNLRPELFTEAVYIHVIDSLGRRPKNARIYYFDENNVLQAQRSSTDPSLQNFVVVGLEPGEYQVVASSAKMRHGLGAHLVRTDHNTITQVQF